MAKQVYVFRAKLKGWRGVRRTIAMRDEHTLDDLHDSLQAAFGWDDEHPYAFWLGGKFWAPNDVEYVHPLVLQDGRFTRSGPPSETPRLKSAVRRLDHLRLSLGQRIAYVFDFGDEWRVRLTLREVTASDGGHYPRVLESVGDAPAQYLDYDELNAA
jgi:hypothetical protein